MQSFEFATASQIIFGSNKLADVGSIVSPLGQRAFIVIGASTLRAQPLFDYLKAENISYTTFNVVGEPTIETARLGLRQARQFQTDIVIGLGGGAVIDTGKAIASLLTNQGDILDYLEVVGQGQPLVNPSLPYIAIPTTAGTGAEVTRNAVLGVPEERVKVSLRSPMMLPTVALVDPDLTHSMPPPITATTGLDALTQLIEPYVSPYATPLTDSFCLEGINLVARSLRTAYRDGDDWAAREDMALASLLGGLALANAKLGVVHGIAGPFGGMFEGPHGAICAALLPDAMAINIQALQDRLPESDSLYRYLEIAQLLTGNIEATAEDGVTWVKALCQSLNIAPLSAYGLQEDTFPELIKKSQRSSSMKGNPIELTEKEIQEILRQAL
ncbi:MAG: iron-containing alcohol dehydrogenase [Chloroflexota bacterium]